MCHHKSLIFSLVMTLIPFMSALRPPSQASQDDSISPTDIDPGLSTTSQSDSDLQLSVEDDIHHCLKVPLTPHTWRRMNMDSYLKSYPGGYNLTLPAYAETVGATNFQCGIGSQCSPSQLCDGIDGQDWYALAAAHRWNTFNNQVYEATAYSIAYISDITPTMVDDLIPEASSFWNFAAVYIGLMAASICGVPSIVFGMGALRNLYLVVMSAFFFAPGAIWVMANLEVPDPHKFTRWSEVVYQLQEFQSRFQAFLTQYSTGVIESSISSDKGLYGIAKNGTIFSEPSTKNVLEIQSKIDLTLKLKSLFHILRVQKAFITRGREPCNGDGPGGALAGPDQLSHCDDSGIMMNIVRVGEKDEVTVLYNAPLIQEKYGLSTQLLTEAAWQCQKQFGVFEHPSVVNTTNPYDTSGDCMFDLAVCDFTSPEIREMIGKMSTVEICRKVGKLPI